MNPFCKPSEHISRRAFLKGTLLTGAGTAVANWGHLFKASAMAAETGKKHKHCILLWMNGGPSQIDTFDMKPGQPTAGPFRPVATNVTGIQVSEYLPQLAQQVDKLAIIRSMNTQSPDHPDGIYNMHTGYRISERVSHPELGAMIAKYAGPADSDLPSFVRMGPCGNAGSGYLGPQYQPFGLERDGRLPAFTTPYLGAEAELSRNDLLRFVDDGFAQDHKADPFAAHRLAKEKSWRLLHAKGAFDFGQESPKLRERYGDSQFGRGCLLARRLVEAGVTFIEVGQDAYDGHCDNFVGLKANLGLLDPAYSTLLHDLEDRGLLQDTLVVWMGEVGRTPEINNRAGRDHYIRGWTIVLAGGGIKGGQVYGATGPDGRGVKDNPVTEGDLFSTIYTALGVNPRVKHFVGTRPIWATPENSKVLKELLG
jgi:Protein of unknown function (DUF1501)/TAT (twin-arginine translocation) pathway signal sequence